MLVKAIPALAAICCEATTVSEEAPAHRARNTAGNAPTNFQRWVPVSVPKGHFIFFFRADRACQDLRAGCTLLA